MTKPSAPRGAGEAATMKRPVLFLVAASVLWLPARAQAQAERYELGLRLRAFEAAFDEQTDPESRKRPVKPLKAATFAFLASKIADSARGLDRARFLVRS